MKDIFCSSPTPVWTVRQPACMVTETTTEMLFLCSVIQSSSFQRHIQNISVFASFPHAILCGRVFPSLLLFLLFLSPVIHQWKFTPAPHQICCKHLLRNHLVAMVQLQFECGCVHFWCDALLLFLLLGSIEKVVPDIYFDDVCHFSIIICLCQTGPLPIYLGLPTDYISVCQFLSQAFYTAQGIDQM